MGIKLIKANEGVTRNINKTYKVTNFLTKNSSDDISVAISEAIKHSETTKNSVSNRVYYVLEGKLIIKKQGKTFIAEPGDVVFIPKSTDYHFEGTFKTILINSPAFEPQYEHIAKI
ncbi:MAG: cupin domain-containing protein [Candidatus Nanoarchaeia archaeon]|nr:cupin domain-containing protein [Candidatus Nanoarchaeia archaeon]MDD5239310.1 cupin domain-containing protein [Candidatus Nanoarchaeia archaeon]